MMELQDIAGALQRFAEGVRRFFKQLTQAIYRACATLRIFLRKIRLLPRVRYHTISYKRAAIYQRRAAIR